MELIYAVLIVIFVILDLFFLAIILLQIITNLLNKNDKMSERNYEKAIEIIAH